MRYLLVAMVLASFCIIPIGNSYAQTSDNLAIFVQIKVENSNGDLVSYQECTKIIVTDAARLNLLLNQNSPVFQKSMVSNGQQKFEVIKANDTIIHQSATIVSQDMISETNGKRSIILAVANHDGYPVIAGDKAIAYWTIIRPAS